MTAAGAPATSPAPPTHLVQGRAVRIPVVVRDAVAMSAMFPVRAAGVRRLLPTPRLHPAEWLPGWAICVLAAIEYRDNDLGRYNELGVNFLVTYGPARLLPLLGLVRASRQGTLGAYVHRLPVTTSFSCDAGRDIWGFPKTVDEIVFEDVGERRVCRLESEGAHVLTLAMQRGGTRTLAEIPQDAYAWRDGRLFKTPSRMRAEGVGFRVGGATVALGAHPLADELRALGFPRRALGSTWFGRWQATFDDAVILERGATS
ncbi:MAG: acetoacetate decarboxylase family protein [Deltaproteobacteria bacterium]|nr:acetoacetate decarboxylase family protein [Deltaproteobacteria bacterium]